MQPTQNRLETSVERINKCGRVDLDPKTKKYLSLEKEGNKYVLIAIEANRAAPLPNLSDSEQQQLFRYISEELNEPNFVLRTRSSNITDPNYNLNEISSNAKIITSIFFENCQGMVDDEEDLNYQKSILATAINAYSKKHFNTFKNVESTSRIKPKSRAYSVGIPPLIHTDSQSETNNDITRKHSSTSDLSQSTKNCSVTNHNENQKTTTFSEITPPSINIQTTDNIPVTSPRNSSSERSSPERTRSEIKRSSSSDRQLPETESSKGTSIANVSGEETPKLKRRSSLYGSLEKLKSSVSLTRNNGDQKTTTFSEITPPTIIYTPTTNNNPVTSPRNYSSERSSSTEIIKRSSLSDDRQLSETSSKGTGIANDSGENTTKVQRRRSWYGLDKFIPGKKEKTEDDMIDEEKKSYGKSPRQTSKVNSNRMRNVSSEIEETNALEKPKYITTDNAIKLLEKIYTQLSEAKDKNELPEGPFRQVGEKGKIDMLLEELKNPDYQVFDNFGSFDSKYAFNDICSACKNIITGLEIIDGDVKTAYLAVPSRSDRTEEDYINNLTQSFRIINPEKRKVLKSFLRVCVFLEANCEVTKMNCKNLAICLGKGIYKPHADDMINLTEIAPAQEAFEIFFKNREILFPADDQ